MTGRMILHIFSDNVENGKRNQSKSEKTHSICAKYAGIKRNSYMKGFQYII